VGTPAISSDGKQLVYAVARCDSTCRYAIELKDVGGATTRRILDGATAAYHLQWSPDRRNLLFTGTIDRRYGVYLVSALGGAPRLVTSGRATFWAGGDSLLISTGIKSDSVYWLRIAGLDGSERDSIRIAEAGKGLFAVGQPATQRILAVLWHGSSSDLLTLDRQGRVLSRQPTDQILDVMRATSDALWLRLVPPGPGAIPMIVRLAIAPKTGELSTRWDTVYVGQMTSFDVTGDGGALVVDEGSSKYSGWTLDMRDALRGVFLENRRFLQSTAPLGLAISPDGNRLLVRRSAAQSAGAEQLSVAQSGGGSEVPVRVSGRLLGYQWTDSVTVQIGERMPTGIQLRLVDARTGAPRNSFTVPDSGIQDFDALPNDAWSWIPSDGRTIKVQAKGDTAPRSFNVPDWYLLANGLESSPDGKAIAVVGWNAATYDSTGLRILTLSDGKFLPWSTWFSEGTIYRWLPDGSIAVANFEVQQAMTLYRVRGPGQVERLGAVPRQLAFSVSFSDDMRRISLVTNERRGDIWMSTVVR
jgi:hypothetical protein